MKKLVTISKLTVLAALAVSSIALASKRSADDQGDNPTKAVRFTNPTDQQTPAGTTITLVSSDDHSFDLSHDLAMLSGTIKNMLADSVDANQNFPLPNISSATTQNLIPCLEIIHAANGNQAAIKTELSAFITNLSPEALADLVNAANFLDIPQLLQLEVHTGSTSFADLPDEIIFKIRKHWERDILASNNEEELAQNIKNVCSCARTSKFFYTLIHDPTWVCRLFEQIIASNKFGTVQDLFLLMLKHGLAWRLGLEALLNLGARISRSQSANPWSWTMPLVVAAQNGQTQALQFLLNADAQVIAYSDCWEALLEAAFKGHVEVVAKLLTASANASINHVNGGGNTALTLAAFNGHTKVVKLLLEAGANANHVNHMNDTALILAAFNGHTEIVKFLLEAGAHANHADRHGYIALMLAAQNGHAAVVQLLLTTQNYAYHTVLKALMYATITLHGAVAIILMKHIASQSIGWQN
jgi:hypothetical protein